jgi:hypothetical protein
MSEELLNALSSASGAKLSAEALEMMGKEATNLFMEGLTLNDAVVKIASAHQHINQEQIKRVCEFANNSTYLALHDQAKVAGDDASYPQFELADPSRVVQDISDGARSTVVTRTDLDYSKQPFKKAKTSAAEKALEELFTPSAPLDHDFSRETAAKELLDAKHSLVAVRDQLSHSGETFDQSYKAASAELYGTVKDHLLDGHGLGDVIVAVRSTGIPKEKISEVMQPVIERLIKEKVASPKKLSESVSQIEKVAHRVVNQEHPVIAAFMEVVQSSTEIEKVAAGLQEVEGQLEEVEKAIKESFFGAAKAS